MTSVVSSNFTMAEGGITSTTSDGLMTGISNDVPKENGLLSFTLAADTIVPEPTEGVYCVLVRTEILGFLGLVLIASRSN